MSKLFSDYTFSDRLHYESHLLVYTPENEDPLMLGGMLGAALFAALLVNTDEGDKRGIALETDEERKAFFAQYEHELIREDGGLLSVEIRQLNDAYVQIELSSIDLPDICPQTRLLDLALQLLVEYMQQIVIETFRAHIWEAYPWKTPFAQWLWDAAHVETRRQLFLQMDWTDPPAVSALAAQISSEQSPLTNNQSPLFFFEGEAADDILCRYYDWLWAEAQKEAKLYPDANVQLAQFRTLILEQETNYDFLKPEMKDLPPESINLFRKWMNQWIDFVQTRIQPATPKRQKKAEEQLFFPDEVLRCPTGDMPEKYAATREYIKERSKYDENFRKFVKNESRARLCRQLTLLFGWYVEPNSLSKSLLRRPKRKTKQYT